MAILELNLSIAQKVRQFVFGGLFFVAVKMLLGYKCLFHFFMVPHFKEHAFVEWAAEYVGCTHIWQITSANTKQLILPLTLGKTSQAHKNRADSR